MSNQSTNVQINKLKKSELLTMVKELKVTNDQLTNTLSQVRSRKDELAQEIVQLHEAHKKALYENKTLADKIKAAFDETNASTTQMLDNAKLIEEVKDLIVNTYRINNISERLRLFWVGVGTHISILRKVKDLLEKHYYVTDESSK